MKIILPCASLALGHGGRPQRALDDFKAMRAAGLDRLHLGLETGDDALFKQIKKGVTADGQSSYI